MSRYKASENIKEQHEEKRALSTVQSSSLRFCIFLQGSRDEIPSYMSQTVASLKKRESFNYSGDYNEIRNARRENRMRSVNYRSSIPSRLHLGCVHVHSIPVSPQVSSLVFEVGLAKRPNSAMRERRLRSLDIISDASSEDDYLDFEIGDEVDPSAGEMEPPYRATFSDAPLIKRNNTGTKYVTSVQHTPYTHARTAD